MATERCRAVVTRCHESSRPRLSCRAPTSWQPRPSWEQHQAFFDELHDCLHVAQSALQSSSEGTWPMWRRNMPWGLSPSPFLAIPEMGCTSNCLRSSGARQPRPIWMQHQPRFVTDQTSSAPSLQSYTGDAEGRRGGMGGSAGAAEGTQPWPWWWQHHSFLASDQPESQCRKPLLQSMSESGSGIATAVADGGMAGSTASGKHLPNSWQHQSL
mmetsp:Transcript_118133/g.338884  ORF Transcript_118133/g.338884 Transcript_118133/m.338884 type:complete len:213 (+) Transcript_118133:40-678(+)